MAGKVYNYKIRVSLREDCKDRDFLSAQLTGVFDAYKLVPLGSDEYGSNDRSESTAVCSLLTRCDWFLDNAKELIRFNGGKGGSDDPDSDDFYFGEDLLEAALKRRNAPPPKELTAAELDMVNKVVAERAKYKHLKSDPPYEQDNIPNPFDVLSREESHITFGIIHICSRRSKLYGNNTKIPCPMSDRGFSYRD